MATITPTTPKAVDTSGFTPQQLNAFNSANALGSGVQTYNSAPAPVTTPTTPPPVQPPAPTVPPPAPTLPQATTSAPTATQPQGAQQQAAQGQTTTPFNGSVVDLLNSAGVDSSFQNRQQLATQYGINGYTGTAAQNLDLGKKYQEAHAAIGGTAAPQSGAAGRQGVADYMAENQDQPQEDPQKSFFDNYMAMNPIVKQVYDEINHQLSTPVTSQTFQEQYAQAFNDVNNPAGLPGESLSQEQMKAMNIKNIMDGTEDDIRTEIGKAGGFATESQVQALSTARNKTLLKQAQVLQQSMALKQDYVDQLMQFSEKDRAQVEKEVDRKLGLTEKLADIQDKITSAAADNYQKVVDKVGYSGLYSSLKGDPQAVKYAEQSLGLSAGSLASLSGVSTGDQKYQFVSGTDNQAAGIFDPKTGTFTPMGGGGSGGGGTVTGTNPGTAGIIQTILGSGKFTKQQAAAITNAIANGEDPITVVKNQAKGLMNATEAAKVTSYEAADASMIKLQGALNAYYDAGGDTGLLSGTMEQVANKMGQVKDPAKVQLATRIAVALQSYRNAISGTAYSNQEGQQISAIFPGINKTHGLNDAIIQGRLQADQDTINGFYGAILGKGYEALLATTPEGQVSKIKQETPPGQIAVARENADGTRHYVYVTPNELWATDIKL